LAYLFFIFAILSFTGVQTSAHASSGKTGGHRRRIVGDNLEKAVIFHYWNVLPPGPLLAVDCRFRTLRKSPICVDLRRRWAYISQLSQNRRGFV